MNSNKGLFRAALLGTAALGIAAAGTPARAQSAQAGGTTVDEIVVTVAKREQQIQDVPLSVSALGGNELQAQRVIEIRDLTGRVPGLQIGSSSGRTQPQMFLRGVGTRNFNPDSALPVGVYQDEVYFNVGTLASEPFYDLERVEVARGPQGTLWGKNTTAGAVHVITRKPTHFFNGYSSVTYGKFDQFDIEGAAGGSIIEDVLAGRIAFTRQSRGGNIWNDLNGSRLGEYSDFAGRVQLLWTPTEDMSLLFKAKARQLGGHVSIWRHHGMRPDLTDNFGYRAPANLNHVEQNVFDPFNQLNHRGAQLTGRWDLGWAEWLTIAAYDKAQSATNYDDDGGPVDVERSRYRRQVEQTTLETRLTSEEVGPLSWIVGYHFLFDNIDNRYNFVAQNPVPFGTFGIQGVFDQQAHSHAVYGSVTWRFSPEWSLIAGARYTAEKKSANLVGLDYMPNPIDPYEALLATTPPTVTSRMNRSQSYEEPTWDLTLQYQPTADLNLYGKYARGFRAGGFNSGAYLQSQVSEVQPETVDAYEVGVKSTLLDGRLRFAAAAYYYKFTDLQVFFFEGSAAALRNAAEGIYKGLDFELHYSGDFFNVGGTYNKSESEISGYSERGPDRLVYQIDGRRPPYSPAGTASVYANYTVPVTGGDLILHTDWVYKGEIFFDAVQLPQPQFRFLREDAFWTGNARVTYRHGGGRYEVAAWVRNITDERRRTNAYVLFSNVGGSIVTDPRAYGVTLRTEF